MRKVFFNHGTFQQLCTCSNKYVVIYNKDNAISMLYINSLQLSCLIMSMFFCGGVSQAVLPSRVRMDFLFLISVIKTDWRLI